MTKYEPDGNWTQIKGQLKSRWGRFSDADVRRIEVNHHDLAVLLQDRYGLLKEQADQDSKAFFDSCGPKSAPADRADESAKVAPKEPLAGHGGRPVFGGGAPTIALLGDAGAKRRGL